MVTVGRIHDPRCVDALDVLKRKQLPSGGWPAEKRYYKTSPRIEPNADHVDWGGTSKNRMNPWVTVDALAVLRAANRGSGGNHQSTVVTPIHTNSGRQ
jgi:hypothetical protein